MTSSFCGLLNFMCLTFSFSESKTRTLKSDKRATEQFSLKGIQTEFRLLSQVIKPALNKYFTPSFNLLNRGCVPLPSLSGLIWSTCDEDWPSLT